MNTLAETVGLYQPDTDRLVANAFPVGSMPNDIAWHDGRIFVVNSGDNSVTVYDQGSFDQLGEIYLGTGRNPYSIAIAADHGAAYVANFMHNSLSVIDLTSLTQITEVLHSSLQTPQDVAVYQDFVLVSSTAYQTAASFGPGSVTAFLVSDDGLTYAASFVTGDNSNPQTMLVVPERGEVHVALTGIQSADDGEVVVLDLTELPDGIEELHRLDTGGSPSIRTASWHQGEEVFYLSGTKGILSYHFDGDAYAVLHDSADPVLPPGGSMSFYSGVAVDESRDMLLITDFPADSLMLLARQGYHVVDEKRVSDGPLAPLLVE